MLVFASERSRCAFLGRSMCPTVLLASAVALAATADVRAQLTLTQAGIDRGFRLTTFASGFPSSSSIGPEGMGFAPDGSIWVATPTSGNVQRFQNVDDQNAATAPILASYGAGAINDLQFLGTTPYMSQFNAGRVVELNANGTLNRVVATGISGALGLAPNPFTGRVFVSSPTRIVDLDPATGSFTNFATGDNVDGLTLSPDGSTLYAAVRGTGPLANRLIGYNTGTRAITFDSGVISGGMDGTVLGYGQFAGYIYANMTNGTVIEINLSDPTQRVTIASGGSRGDFAYSHPSRNGDMFLTQTNSIMRLSGIPAPSTLALVGLGGALAARRRRA